MGSDASQNRSVHAFSKDFGKKKRTNRLAKLKQCKLDARREQWLSQAKDKGCKEEPKNGGGSPPFPLPLTDKPNRSSGILEMRSRRDGGEGDMDSLTNNLISNALGGNDSRKHGPWSRSSSSSSSGFCSGSFSNEEEEDGCLDDWEAVADALTANDKHHAPNSKPPWLEETPLGSDATPPKLSNKVCGEGVLKPECKGTAIRIVENSRAWRPDDAFRPQSLPNLSKQYSFPMHADHHCGGRGASTWSLHSITSQPSSCPICFEDLDLTDSSFLPCLCGFRLCLFCHKRILEADCRCPGCRKQYDPVNWDTSVNGGAPPFRLARSYSMTTWS